MIDSLIDELMEELPAVLVVGPRAAGKTTTARRHVATVIRLDRPAEAVAFRADPDAALRELEEPVLLDEWQAAPEVLGAVKRAVDRDPRPGRYLLTGSVRAELNQGLWPGTGRLVRIPLYGMTVREQLGRLGGSPFLDRLLAGERLRVAHDPPDLRGYVELALRSGFPQAALGLSAHARERWLESYLAQLLTRDLEQVGPRRDSVRLRRYFEAYALNSAGVADERTLFEAAGINRRTAVAYEQLLRNLYVADVIPAWRSNRLKRLVLSPKRYVADPGLVGSALRVDVTGVLRDGDLLGRMLDTFCVAQLRAELAVARSRPALYHLRQEQGRHEIDVIGELGGGYVVAVEVKAASAPTRDDARHIAWLRDRTGDRFLAGVVLHTGPRDYALGERIVAAPICTLWA